MLCNRFQGRKTGADIRLAYFGSNRCGGRRDGHPSGAFRPSRFLGQEISLRCWRFGTCRAGELALARLCFRHRRRKLDRPAAVEALQETDGGLRFATQKLRATSYSRPHWNHPGRWPPEGDEHAHRNSHHSPNRAYRQMGRLLQRVLPTPTNVTSVTHSSHSSGNTPAVPRDVPMEVIPCSMPRSKSHIAPSP
jgi:hypothetical protein